jgi:hypothetical protein
LAVLTVGVYSAVGHHPFVDYDDQEYVINNAHVKAGLTWDTFTWALTATEASNWHPVTWLSHALDCELYDLNASGHHWTNLLIHVVNVILLFLLLQRVTRETWRSLFVAALFALHPLNVESVAWIAERKNVLSTMFFLLALGAYGWYAQKPNIRRYGVLVVLFVLGLASKPMVITLPFVLMLMDYWPLQRIESWIAPSDAFPVPQARFSDLLQEKIPLLALSLASAIITVVAQTASVVPTAALPFAVRLETALYSYGLYVWKMFWPARLALIYPHPGRTLAWWYPVLGTLMMIGVSLIAWQQRSKRPYVAVGWLWYVGTAVPIIGIMQVGLQVVADRYAYVTLIGLFVIVAWTLIPSAKEISQSLGQSLMIPAAAAVVVLAALSFVTWRQVGYWRSTIDLWEHALQVTTDNTIAENFLANNLFLAGRYQEGMSHLRNYARLEPLDPTAHARVAADLQDHGQLPEAVKEYGTAIRARAVLSQYGPPGMGLDSLAITYANLGLVYAQLGDAAKARENAKNAVETDSAAVSKMIARLTQAVNARPSAQGYLRLGLLNEEVGEAAKAQESFTQARRLDPNVVVPPALDSPGKTP